MLMIESFIAAVSGVIDDPEFSGGNVAKGASGDTSSNIAKSAFGKLPRISGSLKILASDTIKNTAGTANAIASQVKGPWKNARFVKSFKMTFSNLKLSLFKTQPDCATFCTDLPASK